MLQKLMTYLLFAKVYGISLLPFPVLYIFSDIIYFLTYHVFGYRRKVVRSNLCKAFPDKSRREIVAIERRFYHSLADIIVETFKMMTLTAEQTRQRMPFDSLELYEKFIGQGRSCIVAYGHLANWEWTSSAAGAQIPCLARGIYKPLSNKPVDELMQHLRSRLGAGLLPMQQAARLMARTRNQVTATAVISDQKPPIEQALWLDFLHQPTAFLQGAEKLAKMLDFPVIYLTIKREKRGYYRMFSELITETPKASPPGEITREFARRLQRDIEAEPADWLWSHRRWSQDPPEDWKTPTNGN